MEVRGQKTPKPDIDYFLIWNGGQRAEERARLERLDALEEQFAAERVVSARIRGEIRVRIRIRIRVRIKVRIVAAHIEICTTTVTPTLTITLFYFQNNR